MGFRACSIPEEDSPDRSLSTDPVESIDWHSMIEGRKREEEMGEERKWKRRKGEEEEEKVV